MSVGDDLLELAVLLLLLLQPLGVGGLHPLRMICSGLFLCLFTCFGSPLPIVAGGKDSQTGRTDERGPVNGAGCDL